MAYSFQPMEQALDSLGYSYIDGVTVGLSARFRVDYDLAEVESILSRPSPSVLAFDSNYDSSYEKKVLDDISNRKINEQDKLKARKERIEIFENFKVKDKARKLKEEEEKALEDERKRLLEIEEANKVKLAEEEKNKEDLIRIEAEKVNQRKLEEEDEWKKFEEERLESSKMVVSSETIDKSSVESSGDKSEDDSLTAEFRTPPQEVRSPEEAVETRSEIQVKGTQSRPHQNLQKINFSDFEAISDPFADLELKSINDLAELQTILTGNVMSTQQPAVGFTAQPAQVTSSHSQNFSTGQYQASGGQQPHPAVAGYFTQLAAPPAPPSQALAARLAQPFLPFPTPYPAPTTNSGYTQQLFPNYHARHSAPQPGPSHASTTQSHAPSHASTTQSHAPSHAPNTTQAGQSDRNSRSVSQDRRTTERLRDEPRAEEGAGQLTPSRSLGDLISSLQQEAEYLRKSPSSRPPSRGSGLQSCEWPQLDNTGQQQQQDESFLAGFRADEATTCRQLAEMGFPLSRLARGCRAVGPDSQKLINFCLVVDRLVEEGFTVQDSEDVAMLHNAEEEVCRKHLASFRQIAEIGFPSKEVHQALIASSFDHRKALEQLIR